MCSKSGNSFHGEPELKAEIEERDLFPLAGLFDKVLSFAEAMNLTWADIADIEKASHYSTRVAMEMCLRQWRKPDPSAATFEELLKIINTLERGDIAKDVYMYFSEQRS